VPADPASGASVPRGRRRAVRAYVAVATTATNATTSELGSAKRKVPSTVALQRVSAKKNPGPRIDPGATIED